MIVHLVSAADGRYDIESIPAESHPGDPPAGYWARKLAAMRGRWAQYVDDAARGPHPTMWSRWRAALVCHLNDSVEEQRSLWALRDRGTATLVHPAQLSKDQASGILRQVLGHARRHHSRWLIVDVVLFAASGLLMLVPGPNLVAYYFAFRVIGHYLAWRGARQGLDAVTWTFVAGS